MGKSVGLSVHWQKILKNNFHHLSPLLSFLEFDESNRDTVLANHRFCLNLPQRLARKMQKNDPHDPLFLQFVPTRKEQNVDDNFVLDPVNDREFQRTPRLLQKYRGRALLLTNGACAMHCRFCFRQNYDYENRTADFAEELSHISDDRALHEVILSGGDPLSLPQPVLSNLLHNLDTIPHIRCIRFHTRFPVGIPERIDDPFLETLQRLDKQVIISLHVNHPRELDQDFYSAMASIQRLGVPVLAQTVLLKEINDDVETLKTLFLDLVAHGILPYYLHALDPVQGAMHFNHPITKGISLIKELRTQLPGYAVPRFAQERPGHPNKSFII